MRTVYKYPVQPGKFTLHLPRTHEVLSVQVQHGDPFVWVLVDTDAPHVPCSFLVVPTGGDMGSTYWDYVGTFQLEGGALVFHLFAESKDSHSRRCA